MTLLETLARSSEHAPSRRSSLRLTFPSEPSGSGAAKSLFASIPQASTGQPGLEIRSQGGSTK